MRKPRLKRQTKRVAKCGPEIGLITENVLIPIAKPISPGPGDRRVDSSVPRRTSLVRPARNRATPFLRPAPYPNHQEWNQILDKSRLRAKGSGFSAIEPSSHFPNSACAPDPRFLEIYQNSKNPKNGPNSGIDRTERSLNFIENSNMAAGSRSSVEEFSNSGNPVSIEEFPIFGNPVSIEEFPIFGNPVSIEEFPNSGLPVSTEVLKNSTNNFQTTLLESNSISIDSTRINSSGLDDSESFALVDPGGERAKVPDRGRPVEIFDLRPQRESSRVLWDKDTNTEKRKTGLGADFFSRTILRDTEKDLKPGQDPLETRYSWQDIETWSPPHRKIVHGGKYPCSVKYSWQVIGRAVQTSRMLLEDLVASGNEESGSSGDQVKPKYSWQIIGTGTQTWQELPKGESLFLIEFPVNEERPCGRPPTTRTRFSLVLNNQSCQTFADKGSQANFSEIYAEICKRI